MRRRAFATNGIRPTLLGSACLLTTLAGTAGAQQAPPAQPASTAPLEEVVVTGIRASLQSATDAKKEAVGFIDSIFAEDIGKFPDTNIAESFNRIPGITITREISGEGLNIAIRGLGPNFTKVLLNGAPVAVASTGRTDARNNNREVDLDLFPTELFTQLTVRKSSSAGMIEGGAAGSVDMRSARPFDNGGGTRLTYGFQGTKNSEADDWGGRGSLLASTTWNDTFGALIGVAGVHSEVRTQGFETIGYTNPNLTAAQCGATSGCNSTGGGNWNIPGTVPANAGNGLTAGTVIDRDFLLARNPGLTVQQLDNALIPRLGRPSDEFGTRERYNGIVSLEYRPTENLNFYVDSLYGKKKNEMERIDMNWVGRFGSMVPLNMTVDRTDCANGCVVTGGTFANAQFFLEYRPYDEDVEFWGVNPGFEWNLTDTLTLDLQANQTKSEFRRDSPTVLVITPGGAGITVDYANDGGLPSITSNANLNDPAAFGWAGGRINQQSEERDTETKGARFNLNWTKWDGMGIRGGAAFDDVSRSIRALDNTQRWQNATCGGDPSVFVEAPNGQPPCQGLTAAEITPGTGGYPDYPGLGQLGTAGGPTSFTYRGSLIPQGQLASYLMPGPSGFITVDWDRFKDASNYDAFVSSAPETGSSNTGATGGLVREKSTGAYVELHGDTTVSDHRLRYTVGVRRVKTEQTIGGRVSLTDPRNASLVVPPATALPDGARYPNIVNFAITENTYYNTLPSAEAAFNVTEQAVVRGAVSKTITRPDPSAQLPGLAFSSPSADVATIGNSALDPFESENLDLAFEYYTGREGYVGVAAFRKRVTGFTTNGLTTVPFTDLAVYGVTFDTLTPQQQAAITGRGGPAASFVTVQQQVNAEGALTVTGMEFNWVQPLDFLIGRWGLDGFGIAANLTLINQTGKGAAPAVALGVAPHTYNATAYYEKYGISARLSTTFTKGSQSDVANQNGIPLAALFGDDYEQWDFSSSVDLSEVFEWSAPVEITFDAINIFAQKQRSYFQFENAAFTQYRPGRQFLVGVRGRF
jgi:TonB-dependent receptor